MHRLVVLVTLALLRPIDARIVGQCDAVKELSKAGISKTFHSNWVCLIQNVSGFRTDLVTGPQTASSYAFGIFQISSRKYCVRGRAGGVCNKKCEDFLNDDIADDVACAVKIFNAEGLKYWDGWRMKCKGKKLPPVNCRLKRFAQLLNIEE